MRRLFLFTNQIDYTKFNIPKDAKIFIDRNYYTSSDQTPQFLYQGYNKWPKDFGKVEQVIDTYPEGQKSPFDIIDFDKLHDKFNK